jgi:hypothetical protein
MPVSRRAYSPWINGKSRAAFSSPRILGVLISSLSHCSAGVSKMRANSGTARAGTALLPFL